MTPLHLRSFAQVVGMLSAAAVQAVAVRLPARGTTAR